MLGVLDGIRSWLVAEGLRSVCDLIRAFQQNRASLSQTYVS
jgi:hypothetical protein